MITKMLLEIFQAIAEDPNVRNLLKTFNLDKKKDIDLETLMNDLNLSGAEREKFKKAYKDYYQGKNPYESQESYKYKYEPKSNDPFDKFDAYYQKFEDQFKEGKNDGSHRQYKKYRDEYEQYRSGNKQGNNSYQKRQYNNTTNSSNSEEKKYYETLEVKPSASFEEIKKAYKDAMKKYHPDRFQSDSQKKYAEDLSRKINVAYDYFKTKFNKN